jgi:phage baseplate assembly protein W
MAVTQAGLQLQGLAFPFQRGSQGFPATDHGVDRVVFNSLKALLTTGRNERVMRPGLGTNIHSLLFDNISAITKARIAADVTRAITLYEPRAELLSLEVKTGKELKMEDTALVVEIVWRVTNQIFSQQIPFPTNSLMTP